MAAKNLPKVFFDVAVNGQPSGRMTFKVNKYACNKSPSNNNIIHPPFLYSSFLTLSPRPLKTSVLSVLVRRVLVSLVRPWPSRTVLCKYFSYSLSVCFTKVYVFLAIVLFLVSWLKVVVSKNSFNVVYAKCTEG